MTKDMLNITDLVNRFLRLEDDMELFGQLVGNVHFWERIRMDVFMSLYTNAISDGSQHIPSDPSSNLYGFTERLRFYMESVANLNRIPLFVGKHDLVFLGSQRRLLREDGMWWDIYTDPIIEELDLPSVSLEYAYHLSHRTPPKTGNLRYMDFFQTAAALGRILGLGQIQLSDESILKLQELTDEIQNRFDISVNIQRLVRKTLARRNRMVPLYRILLKRIRPKVVTVVVSYGKEDFIEACKSMGIPVVELQHGVINEYHLGYSFPRPDSRKLTFPDYLLVFGDYWKEVHYPLDEDHVVSVGFPHIDIERKKYRTTPKKRQIVFISQPVIGNLISRFATDLSRMDDFEYEIIYKLHPLELEYAAKKYRELYRSDIQVIDDLQTNLYHLFASSEVQVGISSTALYEGLAFGLKTYLIDGPGVEYFNQLISSDVVSVVDTPKQIADDLRSNPLATHFDANRFFKPNAVENILGFLRKLVQERND